MVLSSREWNPHTYQRSVLGLAIAGSVLFGSVAYSPQFPKWARLLSSLIAIGNNAVGMVSIRRIEALEPDRIADEEVQKELVIRRHLQRLEQPQQSALMPQFESNGEAVEDWGQPETNDVKLYNWDDLVDEAVGVIIAGQSGAGKTSVACWVLGKLTENEPARIKVCDPHYNDIWEEIGLPAIGEFDEIQAEFEWLLAELDRRRIRKKNKEPLGENLIIVADEIGACIESFDNPEIIQKTLKRIGSEGRKFGITLVAIDQSPNSADIGISAKKRDNYLMIGLCSVAVALAKQDLKNTDPIVQYLSAIAYPCVVKMGGIITPAIHPTHHSYTQFKKKGNAPLNLLPINQLPELGVVQRTTTTEPHEPVTGQGIQAIEPPTEEWDGTTEIPPSYVAVLVQGIRIGLSKNKVLEVLNIKKGGSQKYQLISQRYDELKGCV